MKWFVRYVFAVFVVFCAVWFVLEARDGRQMREPMAREMMGFGSKLLLVQVAENEAHRRHGLSGRKVDPAEGMFFDFKGSKVCFWMKETPSALSAAWLDAAGTVLGVVEMAPESLQVHCGPPGTVYGVEALAGFFSLDLVGVVPSGVRFGGTKGRLL